MVKSQSAVIANGPPQFDDEGDEDENNYDDDLELKHMSSCLTEANGNGKKRSRAGKTPAAKIVWTPEEDQQLRELVEIHGDQSWHRLCKFMPNKTEIRCFKRWKYLKKCEQNDVIAKPHNTDPHSSIVQTSVMSSSVQTSKKAVSQI